MGPVLIVFFDGELTDERLEAVDAALARLSDSLQRTRKRRVWFARVRGRPIDVHVGTPADAEGADDAGQERIVLACGVNQRADYDAVRHVAAELARVLGGRWTQPTK